MKAVLGLLLLLSFVSFVFSQDAPTAVSEKYELKPVTTELEVEKIPVAIKTGGTVEATPAGEALHLKVDAVADLSDFQSKAIQIVQSAMNENEECDHLLNFTDVTISPQQCAEGKCESAQMVLTGRYEKKVCLLGMEKSVLKQGFTCSVTIFPEIANNKIHFRTKVSEVTATGALGKVMELDFLRDKIAGMIDGKVQESTKTMDQSMGVTMPPEVAQFKPQLTSVSFGTENKKLLLRISGTATVPPDHVQQTLQILKQQN